MNLFKSRLPKDAITANTVNSAIIADGYKIGSDSDIISLLADIYGYKIASEISDPENYIEEFFDNSDPANDGDLNIIFNGREYLLAYNVFERGEDDNYFIVYYINTDDYIEENSAVIFKLETIKKGNKSV